MEPEYSEVLLVITDKVKEQIDEHSTNSFILAKRGGRERRGREEKGERKVREIKKEKSQYMCKQVNVKQNTISRSNAGTQC